MAITIRELFADKSLGLAQKSLGLSTESGAFALCWATRMDGRQLGEERAK
jgi:hypothetical protein